MTSIIKNIFEDNLIEGCIQDSFLDKNCIIGSSTLFFSLLIFVLNIIALVKLTHYYKRINFETNLILFSIFQVIIIQLSIITSYEILISCFILIQIFIITLIIRKFVILSTKPKQPYRKNGLFIFLNTISMLLFLLYTMLLIKNNKENSFSIILLYSLFYFLSTVILTFYCNLLIQLIKKLKKKSEMESSSNSLIQIYREHNKEEQNNNSISITVLSFNDIFNNNEMFYSMRRKQIKPLYKINMICALSEFLLMFSILLIPYDNFKQDHYKIIPTSLLGYILFYLYLFICLFNVSANFFCFFWKIRIQYKEEISNNRNGQKKIIDNRYLKRETINMEKEEPKQVNDFIENDNNKKDPKKFEKSIYMSSFGDISEENNESFFVKPENNKNEDNNNNDNELDINGKKMEINNEISVNKELLEPFNNNFANRESIPYTIDSTQAINRNTTNSISNIDQEI